MGGINDTTFNTVFGASSLVTDAASNLYCYAYQQYDSVNTNNIVKWDGGKWNVLGGSSRRIFDNGDNVIQGMNVDAAGNVYASSDTGTAGKVYFIAELSVTSTLPIKLLSFTAKESGDNVVLNWSATNETNASYYLVQRSIDGTNFTDIDKQDANGTGDYLFVDKGLSNQNATYYYRLEMLDNSGTRTFSKVVSCEWLVASKQLVVYPNPIKDVATIQGNHIASVEVIDNIGRMVSMQTLHDATNPTLSVSGLAAGVYHLLIQTTDNKVSGVGFVKE